MRKIGTPRAGVSLISITAAALLAVLLTATPCLADIRWTANGVQVRGAGVPDDGVAPEMVGDGSGGTIITWQDNRSGQENVYAQKMSPEGTPQWTANGVLLRGAGVSGDAATTHMTADGSGGAIVTWQDNRSGVYYIYAARISSSGVPRWTANGVRLRGPGTAGSAGNPEVIGDASGGAIVIWQDYRSGSVSDLYAQRVNSAGTPQWTADGVMIRGPGLTNGGQNQKMVPDGSGGAIVTWEDGRSMAGQEVFAQRVLANGGVQWLANGIKVRSNSVIPNSGFIPQLIQDGSGNVIITWQDNRAGPTWGIYAQKVSLAGAPQWTANGVEIRAPGITDFPYPQITSDSSGGAIVTWVDDRSGQKNIYARKINASGAPQWTANGVMVRGAAVAGNAYSPRIVSDGAGGALIAWEEDRSSPQYTVFAQKVSAAGKTLWTSNGVAIRGAGVPGDAYSVEMVSDGSGGALMSWEDLRSGRSDIYAQRVAASTVDSTWYLAEGTTAWGFSTYISIANPNTTAVHAAITYMTGSGNVSGGTITLPASSQTTVNPAVRLGNRDFSTKITCTEGKTIAVDRTMSWTGEGAASPEGHSSIGVTSPSRTWYLPEGCSAFGFETWLLIQNPNSSTANCTVTYMIEGAGPITTTHAVPPDSRQSFNMETDIGQKNASIKVESNIPVIPERAMYRNNKREGHDSIGTTTPASDYYMAEGTTAWGFTTWVLIQNPASAASTVTITYMTPSGKKTQPSFTLPGNSRKTIKVNDVSGMGNTDFSTQVHGTRPIIAERSMYWDNGTGEACHDSIGMSSAHSTFYMPDGQTSGGYETWTLVQNPNATAVNVEVSYLNAGGGAVSLTKSVPANSRMTFNMADKVLSGRASIKVTSKTPGKKIMVERAMYWNSKGAGTDTIGGYLD
jgi:hypothetical protein